MRSWLSCTHSDRGSLHGRIVLNLSSGNGRPSRPPRGCTNNTGPRESSLIATAMIARSGETTTRPTAAAMTLIARAVACAALPFLNPRDKTSLPGVIASIGTVPVRRSSKSRVSSTRIPRTLECSSVSSWQMRMPVVTGEHDVRRAHALHDAGELVEAAEPPVR